jgi:uncharacterized peroxidase-related enzyme
MIIATPDPDEVSGYVADLYRDDLEGDGFVFSHTRAMAVNPAALRAFEDLIHAVVPSIGVRAYEIATLAAAAAIGSPHCLLAHGRKALRAEALDEDEVLRLAAGDDGGWSAGELAVIRFARSLSTRAHEMTDADSRALRDAGYDDRQIVDITLAASARNHFSRALQALAVPVEDELAGLSPRLRAALAGA